MSLSFDFNGTCLSSSSRQQLNNILKALKPNSKAADRRSKLLRLIEENKFDPVRGLYIPVTKEVRLTGKFPTQPVTPPTNIPCEPFEYSYFTNALAIPKGWGTDSFHKDSVLKPKERATNIGFLIVTIEFDGKTTDSLEECLSWTRGGNGRFHKSPFAKVDGELSQYRDYRGFSIVFAGNKSIHFHLLFSTKHLLNALWDAKAGDRLTHPHSAIITSAHKVYWDKAAEIFDSMLHPSLSPDHSLDQLTQWRRAPWAVRVLDEDSKVLGLAEGSLVPQLVIHEKILSRCSPRCEGFLVPSDFEGTYWSPAKSRKGQIPRTEEQDHELLGKLELYCQMAWGEYPKPVGVRLEQGEWIVHFRNHPDDKRASTIVMGDFSKLFVRPNCFDRDFILPDGMSADELCESLIGGSTPIESCDYPSAAPLVMRDETDFVDRHLQALEAYFAERVNGGAHSETVRAYRQRFGQILGQALSPHGHNLFRSYEGLGKTSTLMGAIANDIFDKAVEYGEQKRFACFAFRSIEQAELKAAEYRASAKYRDAVVLQSFWSHYEAACQTVKVPPLKKDEFFDQSLSGILRHLQSCQPAVFHQLEERRQRLWKGKDGEELFDSALTMVFTSHDLARTWHRSQLTRIWHNPQFDPLGDQHQDEAQAIAFTHIVFDEPEIDKLLYRIPESLFDWLNRVKRLNKNWKKKPRKERVAIYESEKTAKQIPGNYSFEQCDEWLRLPLKRLQRFTVDYAAIPFGYDAHGRGMYAVQHGTRFYLGVQRWIKDCNAQITFLTTESVVSQVLVRAYEQLPIKLNVLDLHADCDLFPIQVPLMLDKRAAADREKEGRPNITALAQEKLAANPNAFVIGNGVKFSDERVKNFQRVKGSNGLEENDLVIITTFLAPEEYALLNVTGQWLNDTEVIFRCYEDQLAQAVGRNQGFRKTDKGSVVVVCSHRLKRNVLRNCFRHPSARIRLTQIEAPKRKAA